MFFQLGTRQYDGLKSFIAFSEESEAVVVEYALIGRKPQLEGVANSLNTITLSFFFHKDFCNVKDELDALKTSKINYEILPIFSGAGEHYGDYIITSLSIEHAQMDDYGNTTGADVSITLKENVQDNKQQQLQQTAAKNAVATGNKQPVTKSKRTNPSTCNKTVSNKVSAIKSLYAQVNTFCNSYSYVTNPFNCIANLNSIHSLTQDFSNNQSSYTCLTNPNTTGLACDGISDNSDNLATLLKTNYLNIAPDIASVKSINSTLGSLVATLNKSTLSNQTQVGIGK